MTAVDSLAGLLAQHDPDHTPAYLRRVAGRVVAHLDVIREWVREDDPVRTTTLRQQRSLELDDVDAWTEEAALAGERYHYALGVLKALGRPYRDSFNPDERDAVRQDQRDTEAAHDEHAARQAIRP